MVSDVTFVIIGRNESQHLARTFASVLKVTNNIIFVDSNSTDNSISIAQEFGIKTILKVSSNNGTAALSRSIGASKVNTKYIQFLDGDETIEYGWIEKAIKKIEKNKKIAAVHGYKKVDLILRKKCHIRRIILYCLSFHTIPQKHVQI